MTKYDHIRTALLQAREECLAQSQFLSRETEELAESQRRGEAKVTGAEEGDSLSVEMSLVRQLSDGQRQTLEEIDDALRRIDDGTYGRCTQCSQEIVIERLEARPRSTSCTSCASKRR